MIPIGHFVLFFCAYSVSFYFLVYFLMQYKYARIFKLSTKGLHTTIITYAVCVILSLALFVYYFLIALAYG